MQSMTAVPFTVTTPKGGKPTYAKNPLLLTHNVLQVKDGSSVSFKRKLMNA